MNILTSVVALLQVALSFLTVSVGTPQQDQAVQFANQAIAIAQEAIVYTQNQQATSTPVQAPETSTSTATSTAPVAPAPAPVQNPTPMPEPTPAPAPAPSLARIEIISPFPGKGLGREYRAATSTAPYDESNYIELGAVCYDDEGKVTNTAEVQVTATDASQNKTMANTGNVTPRYVNGVKETIYYYPFHYEFKTAGDHVITFTCGQKTESVTLKVN